MFKISPSVIILLDIVAPIVGEPAFRSGSISQAQEAKRAACASDNVLCALQKAGTTAMSFCSECIDVPAKTVFTHVPGVTPLTYNLFISSYRLDLARKSFDLDYSLTFTPDIPRQSQPSPSSCRIVHNSLTHQ